MVWLWAVLWVGGTTLVAVLGAVAVRRRFPHEVLSRHNDVAGFIYAVVGVIYAVLLGFLVITVWEQFTDAEEAVAHEAAEVGDLYRDAIALDPVLGRAMQVELGNYARGVSAAEWPGEGRQRGAAPEAALRQLWRLLADYQPATPAQQAWYAEILDRMNQLGDYRTLRQHAASSAIPALLWGVLIVGAILVIGFTYLFGTPHGAAHLIMVGMVAAAVSLVLFAVFALDHPFQGLVTVSPEAFRELESVFREWGG